MVRLMKDNISNIGKFTKDFTEFFNNENYEYALIAICRAIDATAKKIFPKEKPGKRIKNMIKKYERFIYQFWTTNSLQVSPGAKIFIAKEKQLDDFIYLIIRNSLMHGDDFDEKINISKELENGIAWNGGKVVINKKFVLSLFLIVILDPINSHERTDDKICFYFEKKEWMINNLWGKFDIFLKNINWPIN